MRRQSAELQDRRGGLRRVGRGTVGWIQSQWKRLPPQFRWNIEDSFQPEDIRERLLPGEEPQLVIQIAWYRDFMGIIFFDHFWWVLLFTGLATAILGYFTVALPIHWIFMILPILGFFAGLAIAIHTHVEYRQWRILKTNARLMISIPQPRSVLPVVDNIELKGMPSILDTNWSRNPLWRFFQFFTGARDLYLSMSGYRIVEGTARVGDAIIIPDVMPDDVFELRRHVFKVS